jgi:hypothetical protein
MERRASQVAGKRRIRRGGRPVHGRWREMVYATFDKRRDGHKRTGAVSAEDVETGPAVVPAIEKSERRVARPARCTRRIGHEMTELWTWFGQRSWKGTHISRHENDRDPFITGSYFCVDQADQDNQADQKITNFANTLCASARNDNSFM